jgi:L-glyceraldehyde 3-phosphate reductase
VLPVCAREGIGQIAFGPLAQGALTGKYSGGGCPPGSRGADEARGVFMRGQLRAQELARVDGTRPPPAS